MFTVPVYKGLGSCMINENKFSHLYLATLVKIIAAVSEVHTECGFYPVDPSTVGKIQPPKHGFKELCFKMNQH